MHKKMPMAKSLLSFILVIVVLLLSGRKIDSTSVICMRMGFPHGGLRLLVQRDGDTLLFYAALPTYQTVKNETFDFDQLFNQPQARVHHVVLGEERPVAQPYGMVTFEFGDGSQRDYLIYDANFATDLIKPACDNMLVNEDPSEELFERVCNYINEFTD